MTTPTRDYYACPDRMAHNWLFRRLATGATYRCIRCGLVLTKDELKRNTDA